MNGIGDDDLFIRIHHGLEICACDGLLCHAGAVEGRVDICAGDFGKFADDYQPLNGVLQIADIAGQS